MKKLLFTLAIMLSTCTVFAQESEEYTVQKTIEAFFDGFHNQDSTAIKATVASEVILQTIGKDSVGNHIVKTDDFSKFLKNIVGIPETMKFRETLKSFSIQIDGPMANAWTPYEFHINDIFSHCGVNSFQLLKKAGDWKIIYLIDTRRKEGCQ